MVKLILFGLPLGLDTFAVSAALGMRGLPRRERLKVSLLMAAFALLALAVLLIVESLVESRSLTSEPASTTRVSSGAER